MSPPSARTAVSRSCSAGTASRRQRADRGGLQSWWSASRTCSIVRRPGKPSASLKEPTSSARRCRRRPRFQWCYGSRLGSARSCPRWRPISGTGGRRASSSREALRSASMSCVSWPDCQTSGDGGCELRKQPNAPNSWRNCSASWTARVLRRPDARSLSGSRFSMSSAPVCSILAAEATRGPCSSARSSWQRRIATRRRWRRP